MKSTLLTPADPPPFVVHNKHGTSPYLFVSEHAGNRVPSKLGGLGLDETDLEDHIGLDLHIKAFGKDLSDQMHACYIFQPYSRLIIDCNRPPASEQSILKIADQRPVPGNAGLSAQDTAARQQEIFWPFHRQIAAELDRRAADGQETILVTLHSFTPAMQSGGAGRPWPITFQYGRQPQFSKALMEQLARSEPKMKIGDNVPYPVQDDTHYGIPVHGEQRNLLHTMIELRQDGISTPEDRAIWVNTLVKLLNVVEKTI